MTTRNLVPRADNEGKLGTSSKKWADVNATNGAFSTLKVSSLKLNAVADLDLFAPGAGIETITTNGNNQFVIALDDTFLTGRLGFNADGTKPDFTLPNGDALPGNSVIAAGDTLVDAIEKLNDDLRDVAAPSDLTVASFSAAAITTSAEVFADNDTTLMTSAAIDDRIQSFGYTTNTGDITRILNGTGLDLDGGDGQSGDVTIKLSDTAVTAGSYGDASNIPTFTVDAQGRLTAAGTAAISTSFTLSADAGANDTFSNGGTLTFSGDTGITTTVSNDTITIDLDDTAVAAGAYGSATAISTFTVDAQGRLTAAGATNVAIPSTQVTDFSEAVQDVTAAQLVTNGSHTGLSAAYDDAGDGAIDLSIDDDGVTAAKLNNDIISGQAELAAGLAATDELLVSDAGTVKRMDVSVLQTFLDRGGDGALDFTVNTDEDVSKANLSARLASYTGDDTLNIGDAGNDTNVVIKGNLTVQGTTTTVNTVTMNAANAVLFEGATADDFETTLTIIDPTAARTISLPNQSGFLPVLSDPSTTQITSTPEELNLLDTAEPDTVRNGKAVIYSNTGAIRGSLTGNADTATALETARAIALGGDLGGSANFDGTGDITIAATIQAGSVDNAMLANDGWSLSLGGVAQEDINLGDTLDINGTASQVTVAYDAANNDLTFSLPATINVDTSGNAATASAWENARTITFATGDVTGNFSTDGSANVGDVALTIADLDVTKLDIVGAAQLGSASIAQDDDFLLYDLSATTNKRVTFSNLEDTIYSNITAAGGDVTFAAGGEATIVAGSVTNDMLAGSIANGKLANSTVSFGGVELSLGGSDATPAFDLADATNLPTTSLTGTITNAQLAGSIADSKLNQITTANKVSISAIDLDDATALDNALVAADLIMVDDGANGTNRKATLTQLVTFLQNNTALTSLNQLAGVGTITSGTWQGTPIVDAYVANDLTIIGGSINNSPIGAETHSTGKFTTLEATTSLKLATGATVTAILDEDNLNSNSDTALATQQSIKAYVDAQITAQDLDFQGDAGGALSIDLDSETLTIAGGTGIDTIGADNTLTVAIDSTVTTLAGEQTLTNKTLTSPTVSGLTLSDSSIVFEGATDDEFETTLSVEDPTANRTITLPNASDTLVGRTTSDTLTNKIIDADDNDIRDLTVDNLKTDVLDTDLSAVSANDDTLASAKAIKTYVDQQLGRFGGIFLTDSADNGKADQYNRDVIFDSSPLVRSHFGPFAFDLGQLHASGGSDIIFYGSTATGASDRHFLVVGSGDDAGDTKFTGANENTP